MFYSKEKNILRKNPWKGYNYIYKLTQLRFYNIVEFTETNQILEKIHFSKFGGFLFSEDIDIFFIIKRFNILYKTNHFLPLQKQVLYFKVDQHSGLNHDVSAVKQYRFTF